MFLGQMLIVYVPFTRSALYKHGCCTSIQLYKYTVHYTIQRLCSVHVITQAVGFKDPERTAQ